MDNLTAQEKEEVLRILKEISTGDTSSYKSLIMEDYDEIPVDITTFLTSPKYLGRGLTSEEGKFTAY